MQINFKNIQGTIMKKYFCLLFLLLPVLSALAQEVRDHRNGAGSRPPRNPVQPPPAVNRARTGTAARSIEEGKWYFIRKAGSANYMQMSGHRDQTRSMAYVAVENLQQDTYSQQWRFTSVVENGATVYLLQNRKYIGKLFHTLVYVYLESRRLPLDKQMKDLMYYSMVPNGDGTWFILTSSSGNTRCLSTVIASNNHCHPYESEPVIGGRVLADCECSNTMRREYVSAQSRYTGTEDQKWILEQVRE